MDTLFYEGFFARDTLLRNDSLLFPDGLRSQAETAGRVGLLMPDTLQRNDIITASILIIFAILMLILRAKRATLSKNTDNELSHRSPLLDVIVMLLIAMLLALLFFCYTQYTTNMATIHVSQIQLLGIYVAIATIVIFVKRAIYTFVNAVFFNKTKRRIWNDFFAKLMFLESLLLFPITLLAVFFSLSPINVAFCIAGMLLFVKILLLFKTYSTFFVKFYGIIHLFVYFCALEAVPLTVLWLALTKTTDYLAQL